MKTTRMTKTEQKIVDYVHHCNDLGALAGVSDADAKFAARLAEAGKIVHMAWTPQLGAGWAIVGHKIAS